MSDEFGVGSALSWEQQVVLLQAKNRKLDEACDWWQRQYVAAMAHLDDKDVEIGTLRTIADAAERLVKNAAAYTDWESVETRLLINTNMLTLSVYLSRAGYLPKNEEVKQ